MGTVRHPAWAGRAIARSDEISQPVILSGGRSPGSKDLDGLP